MPRLLPPAGNRGHKHTHTYTIMTIMTTRHPLSDKVGTNFAVGAAPKLKRLVAGVAGFPPRRPGFNPGSGQVGFMVDKVAPGQVFSEYFGFPCHSFHQILQPHHHPRQFTVSPHLKYKRRTTDSSDIDHIR
jgi:hypothetical protein